MRAVSSASFLSPQVLVDLAEPLVVGGVAGVPGDVYPEEPHLGQAAVVHALGPELVDALPVETESGQRRYQGPGVQPGVRRLRGNYEQVGEEDEGEDVQARGQGVGGGYRALAVLPVPAFEYPGQRPGVRGGESPGVEYGPYQHKPIL